MRYEKGHKDASRQRILAIATERFKTDGIAASGLAGIMGEAGMTNGAFYPHFKSKAALVRESLATAVASQCDQMRELIRSSAGQTVPLTYDRGGVQTTVEVPIVANTLAVLDDQGNQTGTTTGGFLGISAANTDLAVVCVMLLLTGLLFFLPFIPGLRDIPRWIPIHKLIWRDYYRTHPRA